jgi:hypothetical protein
MKKQSNPLPPKGAIKPDPPPAPPRKRKRNLAPAIDMTVTISGENDGRFTYIGPADADQPEANLNWADFQSKNLGGKG